MFCRESDMEETRPGFFAVTTIAGVQRKTVARLAAVDASPFSASAAISLRRSACRWVMMCVYSGSVAMFGYIFLRLALQAAAKSSIILSGTNTVSGHRQICPPFIAFAHIIFSATSSMSALEEITTGFLPPSSRVSGIKFGAADWETNLAILVDPVNSKWSNLIVENSAAVWPTQGHCQFCRIKTTLNHVGHQL